MKKIICFSLAVLLCAALTAPAFAGTVGSLSYRITDGELTFTGSGEIPAEAFKNNADIVSVVIPSTVTKIGKEAFSGCGRLTSIVIENGVNEIGEGAFGACSEVPELHLPGSVHRIDSGAFWGCLSMEATVYRTGISQIHDRAFHGIKKLTVTVPAGWEGEEKSFSADSVEYVKAQPVRFSDGYYIFHSALSWDYCLDISGGAEAKDNQANLHLWPYSTAKANIFHLEWDSEKEAYIIRAVHSQKILDVFGFGSLPGANVWQWDDDGADDQRWLFEDADGEGSYYIHTLENGYLDVENGQAGQDANVYCAACSGKASQMWVLEGCDYEASAFSVGSVWIAAAIAAAAVLAVVATVIVKKKRAAAKS